MATKAAHRSRPDNSSAHPDPDLVVAEGAADGAENSTRHRRLLFFALLIGLVLRFGVALTTDNPDGQTLAWGSALMATGHANPWAEVVKHPEHDPIPVDQISAVSLAQGPIGVVAGAMPMWVADTVGLIDLGDQPDGSTFQLGELFSYKVSFLIPEALILTALWTGAATLGLSPAALASRRRQLTLLWAVNPLIIFSWGQGMPDTWTVAIICWATVLMGPMADRATAQGRARLYAIASFVIPFGAFGTKMLPIIMLVPLAIIVARDSELGPKRRVVALMAGAGLVLGAAPYVLSAAVRVNVLDRFELNMLNSKSGIPSLHAMPDAQWSLLIAGAATLYLMFCPSPRSVLIPWLGAVVLTVSTMSSIIPHLMFWAGAAILMIGLIRPFIGVVLTAGAGLLVAWHLITYTWLASLVAKGLDHPRENTGQPLQWVTQHVPLVPTVGGALVSLWFLAAGAGIYAVLRRSPIGISSSAWKMVAAVGPLALVVGMGANVFIAEMHGPSRWAMGVGGQPVTFALERDTPWVSPELNGGDVANTIYFSVDKRTHANPDEIVVDVLDKRENVVATGSIPVWMAEPASEKVAAQISLDRSVTLDGVTVRFSRRATVDGAEAPVVLAGAVAPMAAPTTGGSSDEGTAASSRTGDADTDGTASANATQTLEVVDSDGDAVGSADGEESESVSTTPTAVQRITSPVFRLRDDRSGDVAGLIAGRLLGVEGLVAWLAAAVLAAAGAAALALRRQ